MRGLHLHLPVLASTPGVARRQLRQWLERLGWPREDTEDLLLAVNEAVSNAVEHAYPSRPTTPSRRDVPGVELCVTDTEGPDRSHRVIVTVTDRGRWRPRSVSPGSRGRGLTMMSALADSVDVTATGAGTRVELITRAVQVTVHGARGLAKRFGQAGLLLLFAPYVLCG